MDADRCRLIVIAHPELASAEQVKQAAIEGLVACCILYAGNSAQPDFLHYAETVIPAFHAIDVPVLIAEDSQVMGRCNADGLYLEKDRQSVEAALEKFAPEKMIGCGGFRKRHAAMEIGEANPDFVLMGRLGGDIKPEAHPKNLDMASWWAEVIDIPCVASAGHALDSIIDCARTGAEFVAVERALFEGAGPVAEVLQKADSLLDEHAPRFEEAI